MNEIDHAGGPIHTGFKMKTSPLFTLGALALLSASCGAFKNFNQPLSSDFDPLSAPGSSQASQGAAVVAPTYKAGQWVETAMPNAAFFRVIPKGNARADKILPVATPLKVISTKDTYVKVELDSGDIGFVPEIMVIIQGASAQPPLGPDYGPIPPPVEPGLGSPTEIPGPGVPGLPPSIPDVPSVPGADLPPPLPPVPGNATPDVPPTVVPPTVPGVTE